MKRNTKILVVDDSETNLVLLEAILEDDGFDVEIAFSVKDAEICLQKSIPDLILLDLLMPNENGFDLLKKLKSNENMNHIQIIIVTAFVNDENKIICKNDVLMPEFLNFYIKFIELYQIKYLNYYYVRRQDKN